MSHPGLELKLKEFSVEEQLVLDILTQVNVTRRECEIVSVFPGNAGKNSCRIPPWDVWGRLGLLLSPWFALFFHSFSGFFAAEG